MCDPNPLNYDIPGNGCDDDGDGKVDNVITCDASLLTGSGQGTAAQLLNAMEVCGTADAAHWGLVSASLTNGHAATAAGDGNFTYQHGIFQTFGTGGLGAREGSAFGVLSTGTADVNDSKDNSPYFKGAKTGMQTAQNGDVPAGYPRAAAGCTTLATVFDVIDVKAQIKVPANAKGVSFDFNFLSGEWPEYVCSSYNDSFIAYLTSKAFNAGAAENVSFDATGNPISINAAFLNVCSPAGAVTACSAGLTSRTDACSAGALPLTGTGFDDEGAYCGTQMSSGGASTGWLTTTAPVMPGETITLEFIIWDTGDANYEARAFFSTTSLWEPTEPGTPVTLPTP